MHARPCRRAFNPSLVLCLTVKTLLLDVSRIAISELNDARERSSSLPRAIQTYLSSTFPSPSL